MLFAILLVSSAYGAPGDSCTNDQYTCTDGSCISMDMVCTGGVETDPCDDGTYFED